MQLTVTGEESPIFRELLEEWQHRQEAEPEPEPHDSTWTRVYRRLIGVAKSLRSQPKDRPVAHRPHHRRTAHA